MMKATNVVVYFFAVFVFALATPSITSAARQTAQPIKQPLGVDVGWPQCGTKLPSNHAFGIVNINDGTANTTNRCLRDQLLWASTALGGTKQEKMQLYVNTANPGGLGTSSWPDDNIDPLGVASPNDRGVCGGSDSLACAWQYGWDRAAEDVELRFKPVVLTTKIDPSPERYIWWLDIETENTWKSAATEYNRQSNLAVVEGMVSFFKSRGIRTGLYSTAQQWGQIVGDSVNEQSPLLGLPNWRPGGATLSTAKQACAAAPLTVGGQVKLTQFISRGLDYDYSCDG